MGRRGDVTRRGAVRRPVELFLLSPGCLKALPGLPRSPQAAATEGRASL